MKTEKILMAEVATLYYKKNMTQQEIADMMGLSRQTVSKLLADAISEGVVEITIHDPQAELVKLEKQICQTFGIGKCIASCASGRNDSVNQLMAVKEAVDYVLPKLQKGGNKVAISWGRTIQAFINAFPETPTAGNTVFPLFGATDNENDCFASNELARRLADKLGATLKCAWFPYMTQSSEEGNLLKNLSYYKNMEEMWNAADLAIIGIGNREILKVFEKTFGYSGIHKQVAGDIATHFFDAKGNFLNLYENTLCASADNLRKAKETIAIACGNEKAETIAAALRTKVIDTLITDEHTARKILEHA